MAAKHHRPVARTEPFAGVLGQQVSEGRYAVASEVVRAALGLLGRREASARFVRDGDDLRA